MDKVIVWGTFDLLHKGHIQFLRHARKYGTLYVIVVPDKIVFENKNRMPYDNEEKRLQKIKELGFVKNAFIDCIEYGLKSVASIKPNLICVGYDQTSIWENKLNETIKEMGVKVKLIRLGKYAGGIHTRHLKKSKLNFRLKQKNRFKISGRNKISNSSRINLP